MVEPAQLSAARDGDEQAFRALTEPHRRELTVHCYRMLGSLSDADDAVQETWVRAWQGISRFEGRSSLRSWLYTIATRVCLDAIERRRARALPPDTHPAHDPAAPLPPPSTDQPWLEPLPDELLASDDIGPEARYTAREGVALALLAALEQLPGTQRAALVLRDVLGFSAKETADVLETSVASANSALQRARDTIEAKKAARGRGQRPLDRDDPIALDILGRFMRAWEAGDAGGVVAVLKAEAVFSMPPMPLWLDGREAIRSFLESVLFAHGPAFRARPARANGSPAVAIYQIDESGAYRLAAIDVLEVDADGIRELHAFLGADAARFGLPAAI